MIHLEQTLQDLHIDEQDTVVGKQWVSLSVPEIERIKEIFIEAGFKPPESLGEMVVGQIIYDRFMAQLSNYAGSLEVATILELAAVACGLKDQ